jgi:predicted HAD superfamily phosphohydrolase YqeG
MIIAFDVDGTLIDSNDQPRPEIIALLNALSKPGNTIVVWSGGGEAYARLWVERLKLERSVHFIAAKPSFHQTIDLAIDDMPVKLGTYNLQVGEGVGKHE